jgi:muramidase (phage lysozyme)
VLVKIAMCESGGNPRAVSPGGQYRGKYQFLRATWRAYGGRTRDPIRASERHQDQVALRLYRARGTAPWPSCG